MTGDGAPGSVDRRRPRVYSSGVCGVLPLSIGPRPTPAGCRAAHTALRAVLDTETHTSVVGPEAGVAAPYSGSQRLLDPLTKEG
jgi:hypothetical protein